MPTYTIKSGDMSAEIETKYEAQAKELCIMAFEREKPKNLGLLISVTGGQFVGDKETYVSSVRILEQLGMMTPNSDIEGKDNG